ncbi:ATP-dependent RNA helicase DHX8 [Microthyrium microscopicum]|uniref:ATP-dependent RNA helicase DHX8 n=1 Tax=Microthyrium microscopicum TaxID=703497 RepID=A0A6A6U851_9PEZI|nr:ATP-dependent RNA helicase DHX8 [Microthyrium microscopicum]
MEAQKKVPFRQIRAVFDEDTITVYQAYNSQIADAAVAAQRLDASPLYRLSRMTWIKPSWTWVNYRSGYSYKDANQERILALKITHEGFLQILRSAHLSHGPPGYQIGGKQGARVVVQWDPERSPRLVKLDFRSIQIGIPGVMVGQWISDWIVGIEDVTAKARELKRVLDEDRNMATPELVERGLMPVEREYVVPDDLQDSLQMRVRIEEKEEVNIVDKEST